MTIYPLFVERFGRSLQFCHLEFDKKAIYDGSRSEKANPVLLTLSLNQKDFDFSSIFDNLF